MFGLFGHSARGRASGFLDKERVVGIATQQSTEYRTEFLAGDLFDKLWHAVPLFTMIDAGIWDVECKAAMQTLIIDDQNLDRLALMLFGGHYSTEDESIEAMVGKINFSQRVRARLNSAPARELPEQVRNAFQKSLRAEE